MNNGAQEMNYARDDAAFEIRRTLESFGSFLAWLSFRVGDRNPQRRAMYFDQDWRWAVEAHTRATRAGFCGEE